MAGGVSPPTEALAYLAGLQGNARLQHVENAGFSYARIACKGRYLARNSLSQPVNSRSGLGAHLDGGKARGLINGGQLGA